MTSILKILEDNRDKPLSLQEIMRFSGKAEHKVRHYLDELKKQKFLEVIRDEETERFLLKKNVRLTENEITESKYTHYFSRIKEVLSNLILEQAEEVHSEPAIMKENQREE